MNRARNRNASETAPPDAALSQAFPAGARFAIDGHEFAAIPKEHWDGAERRAGDREARLRQVGFVQLGGVRHILVECRSAEPGTRPPPPISSLLTGRELQVAYSVAEGKGDKVIAFELGISEYTVREHIRRIFHKLNVSKRAALVAQLVRGRMPDDR